MCVVLSDQKPFSHLSTVTTERHNSGVNLARQPGVLWMINKGKSCKLPILIMQFSRKLHIFFIAWTQARLIYSEIKWRSWNISCFIAHCVSFCFHKVYECYISISISIYILPSDNDFKHDTDVMKRLIAVIPIFIDFF